MTDWCYVQVADVMLSFIVLEQTPAADVCQRPETTA